MRRPRSVMTAALVASGLVLAVPGTAHASVSCSLAVGDPAPTGILTQTAATGSVTCTGPVTRIRVTVYLFRYDVVNDRYTNVALGDEESTSTTYEDATASTDCLPGSYYTEMDYAIYWPGGGDSHDAVYSNTVLTACV